MTDPSPSAGGPGNRGVQNFNLRLRLSFSQAIFRACSGLPLQVGNYISLMHMLRGYCIGMFWALMILADIQPCRFISSTVLRNHLEI